MSGEAALGVEDAVALVAGVFAAGAVVFGVDGGCWRLWCCAGAVLVGVDLLVVRSHAELPGVDQVDGEDERDGCEGDGFELLGAHAWASLVGACRTEYALRGGCWQRGLAVDGELDLENGGLDAWAFG